MNPKPLPSDDQEEPPPFFSSWKKIYAFVLSFLALLILLFYVFTKTFS